MFADSESILLQQLLSPLFQFGIRFQTLALYWAFDRTLNMGSAYRKVIRLYNGVEERKPRLFIAVMGENVDCM
jgi:hypothetical protein